MKFPSLSYLTPQSLDEAITLLQTHGADAKLLSGGQSLMPMLAFRLASCSILIDLKSVPGLDRIAVTEDGVELGAKVRWRDIEHDARLPAAHPLLATAVRHIAHYAIRNRGTVGGSLAHGDPASELPALAVACEATIEIAGPAGRRSLPADQFFLSPLVTALAPDEIITSLRLPPWPKSRSYGFQEFARRRGDFAMAGAIIFFDKDADEHIRSPHIGAFGIGDTPLRLGEAEQFLQDGRATAQRFEQAAALGVRDIEIRSDIHADSDYRRALLETLIKRALVDAAERAS
ncbi:MAG TPA: xanthine dehydrogenase family protein subunit M [Bradyrhizobium sp.]|nr:xanthine dehydrogenase family protein subunit M [Bradyrhizobium sp.]